MQEISAQPGRRITFEYVLLEGKNDSVEDALRLVKLLKGIHCKMNLIPINPHSGESILKGHLKKKFWPFRKYF
jgi:adenine C2-methylase RlmN of 23S rRNA A2503 and tRNA A37